MYEISSVIGGQMNSGLRTSNSQTRINVEGELTFVNIAKSVVTSQIAVTERSQMSELAMRKKPEAGLGLGRKDDEEEDIFDMIAKVEKFIKQQQNS